MEKTQSYVAYTIIVQRDDGKPMFLVQHEGNDFDVPVIKSKKDKSGLSQVIDEIKRTFSMFNFDELELSELTNAVIGAHRIPLFVFTYHCGVCAPNDLFPRESNLEWQISDNFKETLQQYDISGVPLF